MVQKNHRNSSHEYMNRVARMLLQEWQMILVRRWGQPDCVRCVRNGQVSVIPIDRISRLLRSAVEQAIREMHRPRSANICKQGVMVRLLDYLRQIHKMTPPALLAEVRADIRLRLSDR